MYACKKCGTPVEKTIEGELICVACWCMQDATEIDHVIFQAMKEMEEEAIEDSRCPDCNRISENLGFDWENETFVYLCPVCGKWTEKYKYEGIT